jgi:hypothetical protein
MAEIQRGEFAPFSENALSAESGPTRAVPDRADSHDILVVPFRGQEIAIPTDPPELLPLLAESGRCGLSLVGEPVPDVNLAGVICPDCNEDDVSWLSVEDGSQIAHCDYCGSDFGLDNHGLTRPRI